MNIQAEYQTVLKGIKLLREIKTDAVEIFVDSMLVINQLLGEYECKNDILRVYQEECLQLLKEFKTMMIEHIPRACNVEANKLAQGDIQFMEQWKWNWRPMIGDDWRKEIADYLRDPSKKLIDGYDTKRLSMFCYKTSCVTKQLMGFYSNASARKKPRI
jgi:hypothetical protein